MNPCYSLCYWCHLCITDQDRKVVVSGEPYHAGCFLAKLRSIGRR